MLSIALVADSDGNNLRPPIPYEPLGSGVEDGLATDNLGSSTVYLNTI